MIRVERVFVLMGVEQLGSSEVPFEKAGALSEILPQEDIRSPLDIPPENFWQENNCHRLGRVQL